MIDINVRLSGGEIGHALLNDPEETYHAFAGIAEDESPAEMIRFADEVAAYTDGRGPQVVALLRVLADKIEAS